MAFAIPDIKTLAQTVRNAFRAEMPGTDAWVWPNNVYVTAKVLAGLAWSLYGRLKEIDRDRFVLTARGTGLDRHAADYGMARNQATYANGPVDLIGTPNYIVPAGSTVTRSDGVAYTTDLDTTLSISGTATANVTCTITGTTGNATFGAAFNSADSNVTSASVNTLGIGQGTTLEGDESLRSRVLLRKQNPPQGGCVTDYVIWAKAVAGVTRAYVDTGLACGLGRVVVYPLMDTTYPANYGIPQGTDILSVQDYINSVKPVASNTIVAAPIAYPIDVVVSGLLPATQAIRQAAADEISNVVYRNAAVSTSDNPVVAYASWFWQAVASVSGESSFSIAQPTANITINTGMMPVVRSVTFT